MNELRKKIYDNAIFYCKYQYKESNSNNFAEYDSPSGAFDVGCKNYTRFGFYFDHLLDPKRYAGGGKNGLAWCAQFVTYCCGVVGFNQSEKQCRIIAEYEPFMMDKLQQRFVASLEAILGLKSPTKFYQEKVRQFSYLAGVPSFKKFCNLKKIKPKDAQLCDLVIFGNGAHIGFVEFCDGSSLFTLEGNTSFKADSQNGGQCCRKFYTINTDNSLTEKCNCKSYPSWQKFEVLSLQNLTF